MGDEGEEWLRASLRLGEAEVLLLEEGEDKRDGNLLRRRDQTRGERPREHRSVGQWRRAAAIRRHQLSLIPTVEPAAVTSLVRGRGSTLGRG